MYVEWGSKYAWGLKCAWGSKSASHHRGQSIFEAHVDCYLGTIHILRKKGMGENQEIAIFH